MLDKEKYQAWVNHPLTQEFHQFLKDYRVETMERWAHGEFRGDDNLMAVARVQLFEEIINFTDDAISEFYNSRKVEDESVRDQAS